MIDDYINGDSLNEECGVFGIYSNPDAAAHTALGLHALQHRGQEAAGIISFNQGQFFSHKAIGRVGDNFSSKEVIDELKGDIAIGHVRYSTSGGKQARNIQPVFAEFSFGGMAIAHNGNLTNALTLRKELIQSGAIFQSTMDTEIFIHLIANSTMSKALDRLTEVLSRVEGAYSLVAMTQKKLIGARDPLGVRPLSLGRLGDSYIIASETCAFDIIGAKFERDIEPGEIVVIDKDGLHSTKPFGDKKPRFCIFEYVYFSRPDSVVEGRNVYNVRKNIGRELAKESSVKADLVVPVPDSGVPAAIGYAEEAGLPFELGIIRNHYIGRTFIEPTDQVRNLGVKLKHNANSEVLKGKEVILIDDSIVRGTTSKKIVAMVREAGATKIHMRIASPPTIGPCYYGVDTPEKEKLIAANNSVEEIAKIIGVDSLKFLSVDGLYRASGYDARNNECPQFCDACFTDDYPIQVADLGETSQLPLFQDTRKA
ncbi:MAG: amidophosphoribosyltransferase [Proteobacteria bacterium]|nr:amidophosphoribosyltransferase [Pseudomonadota bacterium]MDG4548760.1 amidophosphoribosyltransferase [Rickettsiales bacterium]